MTENNHAPMTAPQVNTTVTLTATPFSRRTPRSCDKCYPVQMSERKCFACPVPTARAET